MLPIVASFELPLVNLTETSFSQPEKALSPKILQLLSSIVTSFKNLEFANALVPIKVTDGGIDSVPTSPSLSST